MVNRQIRKVIKTKGTFPNDDAVFKLVFLALQNAQKKWTIPIREWKLALNQFAIYSDQYISDKTSDNYQRTSDKIHIINHIINHLIQRIANVIPWINCFL